ncbi:signal transduction histidine kinase [Nitrosococcus oceani ATCC 19707]|uniref:histidine kinase n=1 Tax=Nitrosococcus oceani (strain ATCC 19707 / BCRC 17464 / JCM 30415 / NCIMB 11848 / C-107) TaxID=323261 RepID=Q3JDA2_NITOC|nr:ATP-binding protein [Nitrosococcus oceani]ABA57194.1 signal transduction histidine kinase [Nitrosococcus oceani ATCC 19707]GEM21511.1 two-component sensor histidine kinase [Nitrosococcus oceani]
MMNRLFWKIFLSFWISLILFAGAGLLAASLFLERTHAQDEIESPRDRHLTYINEARLVAKIEGIEGLKSWLKKLDRTEAIPFLLIDRAGKDLLDRPISSHLAERLDRRRKPRRPTDERRSPGRRDLIQVPGAGEYLLVPNFQAVTLNRVLSRPRVIAPPVIVAAIVSGLVCFLLAGYLTRPIRRLSNATHQFAAGNLSLRVASTMGRRRDEVADLARDFDHMAERLQILIGSQKQLLSDVSHELRSPLARLQVALGLVRQRQQHQTNAELDRIEHEAERLNELIGQLLSLTRLESNTQLTHSEPVDVAALLAEVAENADFEARAANRQVRTINNSLSATIEANEPLLRSALENVVRNAIRYTDENTSVDITLQHDPEHPGWLLVQVRDHGPGVPDDMLTKLFEPFVRVGDARDRESGGYGLGLAIAERAIHLHGGVISASNEPNGGLSVRIRLPLNQAK